MEKKRTLANRAWEKRRWELKDWIDRKWMWQYTKGLPQMEDEDSLDEPPKAAQRAGKAALDVQRQFAIWCNIPLVFLRVVF